MATKTLKPYRSDEMIPPPAVSGNAKRAMEMLGGNLCMGGPGMEITEKLAAGEAVDFNCARMMKSYFDSQEATKERIEDGGERMLEWMLWGGDEGRAWAETIVGQLEFLGKELLSKEYGSPYYGSGIDSGVHNHAMIRSERQTFSDGAHCHIFLIPTLSSQMVLVATSYDGRHRHLLDGPGDDFVMDARTDHRHLVTLPIDIQLPDGTNLRAGEMFLTESDGMHRHGADRLHGTNTDGAHDHVLRLSESLVLESLDIRAIHALLAGPDPTPLLKERGTDRASVSKEGTPVLKEEDIQELRFDSDSFEEEADVIEWMIETGYPSGSMVEKMDKGGWLVKVHGSAEFDQDTARESRIGEGVTAVIANRRAVAKESSEIQCLDFPTPRFSEHEARAYAQYLGAEVVRVTSLPDGRLRAVCKESVGDLVSAIFEDAFALLLAGGVRAYVGRPKSSDQIAKEARLERVRKAIPEYVQISKADDEKQIVYGVVLEPEFVDEEGDIVSAEEIEKACHDYMKKSRVVKFRHKNVLKSAHVVECYIAPQDLVFDGGNGTQDVTKGTWIVGVLIEDKDMWGDVKAKKLNGFSMGGDAYRTPVPS